MQKKQQEPFCECVFAGRVVDNWPGTEYPCWRYHAMLDPILVNNTDEDEACKKQGYDAPNAPISANKQLINWFWDLEDMSPKQLRVFAKDEFDVDLPEEALRESLMKAVVRLSKYSPKNEGRLVFMAHTIRMNFDATQEEIRRMSKITPDNENYRVELTKEEFWG